MLQHIEQRTLPYSQAQLFALVADVDRYREFLPWCAGSRINAWETPDIFYADLVVGYKMFKERFSSKVYLERPHHIYIEYLKGPLKNLRNHWRFTDHPETASCTIDFSVEFEFENKAFQSLASMFFNEVVKRMVAAFEARAAQIYGAPAAPGAGER